MDCEYLEPPSVPLQSPQTKRRFGVVDTVIVVALQLMLAGRENGLHLLPRSLSLARRDVACDGAQSLKRLAGVYFPTVRFLDDFGRVLGRLASGRGSVGLTCVNVAHTATFISLIG